MTKILDIGWEEMRDPTTGAGSQPYFSGPTTTGSSSVGAIRTGNTLLAAEVGSLLGPMFQPGGSVSDNPTLLGGNPARAGKSMVALDISDYGAGLIQNPMMYFYFGNGVSTVPNLTTWSARIIMRCPLPFGSTAAHIFSGLKHTGASLTPTVTNWALAGQWNALTVNRKIIVLNGTGGGGTLQYTGDASQSWGMNGWGRLEVQADSTFAGPNIVWRWYQNDSTTAYLGPLWGTVNGNADACGFVLGDMYNLPLALEDTTYHIGEVEAWSTRDADGEMSNTWSAAAGGAFTSTPTPNGQRGGVGDPIWSFPTATYHRHQDTPALPPHTFHSSIPYGNNGRVFNLWIPGGTPSNTGGWPCVVSTHGGFWTSGDRGQVPQAWLAAMLGAGIAVMSPEYVLGSICGTPVNVTNVYPAYGSAGIGTGSAGGGARFPSDICDVKLSVVRLKAKYAHGVVGTALTNGTGWGINPNLVGIGGFSAGSNTGLMAAFTKGLADNGLGVDCRMATADGGLYNTDETGAHNLSADPSFIFVLGYAIPWDLELAVNNDWGNTPAAPNRFGVLKSSSFGSGQADTVVRCTMKARYATWIDGTMPSLAQQQALGITNAVTLNPSAATNMWCRGVWGYSDFLIGIQHKNQADAFMPAKVAHWESTTVPSIHDWTHHIGKIGFPDDIAFIAAAVAAQGVTPPDPPAVGFAGGLNVPRLTTIATIATPIGGTRDTGVTPVGTLTWDGGNWNDGNWT